MQYVLLYLVANLVALVGWGGVALVKLALIGGENFSKKVFKKS